MSSLALYRRYRPETFAEVIGQEHVTDPLQQALRNNRVNHAYLFSGPRGCGKTTSARILARCLNCEQGPTPSPCGECRSCRDLARNGPGSIDVIEIDAASHGGVDDARELREKAFFGPASSRYKIYIVDEAHMVTSAGFNALLKVVEEPPEHLKFIFATTEPEKVIGTIRSRTHHYPFRLVPPGTLRDHLAEVCERESIAVEEAVLPLAVRAGAGSVRDAMSVMDQLLAGAGEDGVTYAMATALLGYTDSALLDEVVESFATGDGARAFEIVDRVVEGGHDPRRFVTDLLERLRDLVIIAAVPEAVEKGLIDAPADVVEGMRAQAAAFGPAELSRAADVVNDGLTEMRGATSPRLQLELICARVLLPAAYGDERSVQARLDRLERGAAFAGGGTAALPTASAGPSASAAPSASAGSATAAAPPAQAAAPGAPEQPPAPGPAPAAPQAPAASGTPGAPAAPAAPAASGTTDGASAESASASSGGASGRRPGAWPTGPGAGAAGGGADDQGSGTEKAGPDAQGEAPGGQQGRTPGAWPGSSGAGSGAAAGGGRGAPGASVPAPTERESAAAPAPAGPSATAHHDAESAPAPAAQDPAQGAAQVRQMWPQILEAVKNRRRFTWILLSQNAQIVGFDGSTLQLGFSNPGARDSFVGGGSEDVLLGALNDALGVQWKIEAIVDPSGGTGARGAGGPPGGGAPGGGFGGTGGPGGPGGPGPGGSAGPSASPAFSSASTASSAGSTPGGAGTGGGGAPPQARARSQAYAPNQAQGAASTGPRQALATAQADARGAVRGDGSYGAATVPGPSGAVPPGAQAGHAPSPYDGALADDMPAEDDPDLDESALSGHDLIMRELGATVIEEFEHE
ncbi:DNA polymerase III subunit gamma and tau [Streptomyces marispadix]|uniref:DNA-directed DNA polymerase n=1 Tax=Streptomyces marispadix TaxID=2922868 RepID=A0ABS9SZM7_9ACTN|nr:DNA polymerase III subunit gamma and tau [Streptomyces marispadix]MCH6161712.1 DNA polymerase III subunit gamma and tau [Streptomyces marispadix]